jgi:hypothetical protein
MEEVAQIMYSYVSKCKSDKIKLRKNKNQDEPKKLSKKRPLERSLLLDQMLQYQGATQECFPPDWKMN